MKTIINMLAAVLLALPAGAQQRSANTAKQNVPENAVSFSFGDVYRGTGLNYERFFNTSYDNLRVTVRSGFGSGFRYDSEKNKRINRAGLVIGSGLMFGRKKWKLNGEATLLLSGYPRTDFAFSSGICRLGKPKSALVKVQWIYFPYEPENFRHGLGCTIGYAF